MRRGGYGIEAVSMVSGLALLVGWYTVAADYDYEILAGTYVLANSGVQCTLMLAPDHTFTEKIGSSSNLRIVQGQWHRFGEAHMSFSNQFIKVPGEELDAAGEAHGQFEKTLGVWPVLVLAPLPDGPRLRKRLSWSVR